MKNEVRNLIEKGQLLQALEKMSKSIPESTLLMSRVNSAEKQYNMGMIEYSEYSRICNQITHAALELLSNIKEPKINMLNLTVKISVSDFTQFLNNNNLDTVISQCQEAFKLDMALNEKFYNLIESYLRKKALGIIVSIQEAQDLKNNLLTMFQQHQNSLNKVRVDDMKESIDEITTALNNPELDSEEQVIVALELCKQLIIVQKEVHNKNYAGLSDIEKYLQNLSGQGTYAVLKKAGKAEKILSSYRQFVVDFCNTITNNFSV